LSLDLVVASNDASIRRRDASLLGGGTALGTIVHPAGVLRLGLALLRSLRLRLLPMVLNIDVGDSSSFTVGWHALVFIWWLGVLGDNVPGVEQAGDEAEDAEQNVDEGIGRAKAALYPDYRD
jgi:hypothetical protein